MWKVPRYNGIGGSEFVMQRLEIRSRGINLEELVLLELVTRDLWLTSTHISYRLTVDCDPPVYTSSRKIASILLKFYDFGLLNRRQTARGSERYAYRLVDNFEGFQTLFTSAHGNL